MLHSIQVNTYTHNERVLLVSHSLANLVCNTILRHLRGLVVGGNRLVGGDEILIHVTLFEVENLLNTAVEEECDVGVLLGLGNVNLFNALLAEPLSQDVIHALGLEANLEGVVHLVLGHGDKVNLGVGEVGQNRAVDVAKHLSNLADTI